MKTVKALTLGALLATSGTAWATNGNDLVKWIPEFESGASTFGGGAFIGYVSGIADLGRGILFCPTGEVTNGQNGAIVVKFLRNNPEKWNKTGSSLVVEALSRAYPKCPDLQQK